MPSRQPSPSGALYDPTGGYTAEQLLGALDHLMKLNRQDVLMVERMRLHRPGEKREWLADLELQYRALQRAWFHEHREATKT